MTPKAIRISGIVDETAADMFLNWVYRRISDVNPPVYRTQVPGTWQGFLNRSWVQNSIGSDDNFYPGDARYEWMNVVMSQIFVLEGW